TSVVSAQPGWGAASTWGTVGTRIPSVNAIDPGGAAVGITCGSRACGDPVAARQTVVRSAAVHQSGRIGVQRNDPVVTVHMYHSGLVGARRLVVELGVGDQDDQIARVDEVRRRTVDADHASAARPRDDVCLESSAVGDVDNGDLFAGQQVGGVEEVLIDGDRTDIVQVRLSHGGAVDL